MNLFEELGRLKQEAWLNQEDESLELLCMVENIGLQTAKYRKTERGKLDKQILEKGGFVGRICTCIGEIRIEERRQEKPRRETRIPSTKRKKV